MPTGRPCQRGTHKVRVLPIPPTFPQLNKHGGGVFCPHLPPYSLPTPSGRQRRFRTQRRGPMPVIYGPCPSPPSPVHEPVSEHLCPTPVMSAQPSCGYRNATAKAYAHLRRRLWLPTFCACRNTTVKASSHLRRRFCPPSLSTFGIICPPMPSAAIQT